jgi:hypothetical protein
MDSERLRSLNRVIGDVALERARQDDRWGEQNHAPAWWLVILGEEYGEACRAALDSRPGALTGVATLADYRAELVQVAAVAVAAIEALDRGRWQQSPQPYIQGSGGSAEMLTTRTESHNRPPGGGAEVSRAIRPETDGRKGRS